jgi:hypothetical protein
VPKVGRLAVTIALLAAVAGGLAFAGVSLTSQPTTVDYT